MSYQDVTGLRRSAAPVACIKPPSNQKQGYKPGLKRGSQLCGGACAQVFAAALVKCRLKAPKDPSQLYEVDAHMSAVHGSRKLAHSNQLRRVLPAPPREPKCGTHHSESDVPARHHLPTWLSGVLLKACACKVIWSPGWSGLGSWQ